MMSNRVWLIVVLVSTLAISLVVIVANVSIDAFGLYGNSKDRKLKVYHNGRTTKFLFSMNYIPANFSGLFLGSSITENWDVSRIKGERIYNASLEGGNISEEALIARNVFARRHLRLVVVTLFPFLTATHGRKTSNMVPSEYWAGLGSVALIRAYAGRELEHLAARRPENDANGVKFHSPVFVAPAAGRGPARSPEIVDPLGLAEFLALVREAHAHAERVVALIPPYARPVWEAQRAFLTRYNLAALVAFQPDDTVIDFNRPEYETFQREATNFADGTHVSSKATSFLVDEIASLLQTPERAPRVRDYIH